MSQDDIQHNKEVQAALGNKDVASYKVISFPGLRLPKNYEGFVYSKWLRTLRHGNDLYKLIDADAYYKAYTVYIGNVLKRAGTVVRLAVLSDDHDVALGFMVMHGKFLDYVYVQPDFRLNGIARELVKGDIEMFTHVTRTGLTIWNNKFKDWKFNPFE